MKFCCFSRFFARRRLCVGYAKFTSVASLNVWYWILVHIYTENSLISLLVYFTFLQKAALVLFTMAQILQTVNLASLLDRFQAQRMEAESVLAASDQDLIRLGVSTIGDRIRLHDACRKKVEENAASTSQASNSTSQANAARVEHLSIFHPRRHNNTNQTRASARSSSTRSKRAAKKTPWTPTFVCLADTSSSKTPSSFDKQILFKAGLGVKKIKLDLEDNEQTVLDKITSDTKDASGNTMGFPQLKHSGGFEMLRCFPNCRDLVEIDSCWSAKDLRSAIGGGQGKIYLRPIQRSLSQCE